MNRLIAGLLVVLTSLLAFSGSARADDAATARGVLDGVVKQALTVLQDKTLNADDKRSKFKDIAYANMNFLVMSRMSLGQNWNKLSPDQQNQFQAAFKQLIANTYGHLTDDYTDEQIKVTGDRSDPPHDATVLTEIIGTKDDKPNSKIAGVDYRMRLADGQWKVIDFTVDGVSLIANYKSQFQGIMSDGGFDRLLKSINEKVATNAK